MKWIIALNFIIRQKLLGDCFVYLQAFMNCAHNISLMHQTALSFLFVILFHQVMEVNKLDKAN